MDTIWIVLLSVSFFLVLIGLVIDSRLRQNTRMVKEVEKELDVLTKKKMKLETSWEQFDFELQVGVDIYEEEVDSGELENAERLRDSVEKELAKVTSDWYRKLIPEFVALSSTKGNFRKVPERVRKLKNLENFTDEAIEAIENLIKSAIKSTDEAQKEVEREKKEREYQRMIKEKRNRFTELMSNLLFQIDYVARRNQAKSLKIGEWGVNQNLKILDFDKAQENWTEKIFSIKKMAEDDRLLDEAIHQCQGLNKFFQTHEYHDKKTDETHIYTFMEREAVKIKVLVEAIEAHERHLIKMRESLGIEEGEPEEILQRLEALKELTFGKIAESWSELDPGLEGFVKEAKNQESITSMVNQNLKRWAKTILKFEKKVEWLEDKVVEIEKNHSIKLELTDNWKQIKLKIQEDLRWYWTEMDEDEFKRSVDVLNRAIKNTQKKFSTRILEKVDELELKRVTPRSTVRELTDLSQEILDGPSEGLEFDLQLGDNYQADETLVYTSEGKKKGNSSLEGVDNNSKAGSVESRRSLSNGLKKNEDWYYQG